MLIAVTSRETLHLQKAQEIVDATYAQKYQEAAEIFKYALPAVQVITQQPVRNQSSGGATPPTAR